MTQGEIAVPAGTEHFDNSKMEVRSNEEGNVESLEEGLTIRAHKALSKWTRSAYIELAAFSFREPDLFCGFGKMCLEQMSLAPSVYIDPREKVFPITKATLVLRGQRCVYGESFNPLNHYENNPMDIHDTTSGVFPSIYFYIRRRTSEKGIFLGHKRKGERYYFDLGESYSRKRRVWSLDA